MTTWTVAREDMNSGEGGIWNTSFWSFFGSTPPSQVRCFVQVDLIISEIRIPWDAIFIIISIMAKQRVNPKKVPSSWATLSRFFLLTHVEPLHFSSLHWISMENYHHFSILSSFFKSFHGFISMVLSPFFLFLHENHPTISPSPASRRPCAELDEAVFAKATRELEDDAQTPARNARKCRIVRFENGISKRDFPGIFSNFMVI